MIQPLRLLGGQTALSHPNFLFIYNLAWNPPKVKSLWHQFQRRGYGPKKKAAGANLTREALAYQLAFIPGLLALIKKRSFRHQPLPSTASKEVAFTLRCLESQWALPCSLPALLLSFLPAFRNECHANEKMPDAIKCGGLVMLFQITTRDMPCASPHGSRKLVGRRKERGCVIYTRPLRTATGLRRSALEPIAVSPNAQYAEAGLHCPLATSRTCL